MDFDINLILVPITLVFLLIWLLDKCVLKQYRAVKLHDKELKAAQRQLNEAKSELNQVIQAHHLTGNAETIQITEQTPQPVIQAHQTYQLRQVNLAVLQGNLPSQNMFIRWAYEFLPVLLVIVVARAFVIEPFNIPSSSMVPTLHTGDFVLVNKSAYGLRLPLIHTKILQTGSPERGDVAVFRYPLNEKQYFIKRVIGLPGDKVSFENGILSINGEIVQTEPTTHQMPQDLQNFLASKTERNAQTGVETVISDERRAKIGQNEELNAKYFQETLGKHSYKVRYLSNSKGVEARLNGIVGTEEEKWTVVVPEGQYFMMGDNRDKSADGRFWGFVPEENLSGRATYIWMYKESGLKLPSFRRNGSID